MSNTMGKQLGHVLLDQTGGDGGISEELLHRQGILDDSVPVRPGSKAEADTLSCNHCGGVVVLNPLRKRPRTMCHLCMRYICDLCASRAKDTDYLHRTIKDVMEMVSSGKWALAGGSSLVNPILVPVQTGSFK